MSRVFLDTGYLIALEFRHDQFHARATAHWSSVKERGAHLTTTWFVLAEFVAHSISRGRSDIARRAGQRLMASRKVNLIHVPEVLLRDAWEYLVAHDDKDYSLTDCISFVLMEKEEIREALTFDHHFTQAGFVRMPA